MTYLGANKVDGSNLTDLEHIKQSVRDILTTPVGSRVMRREYGSLVPELIDQPSNDYTRMLIQAACVLAITRWEPRLSLTHLTFNVGTGDDTGTASVDFEADRIDGARASSPISATVALGRGAA
ncbi:MULTISPECIES: GPW/gp25 family protein [Pandoraea]|uniref:GPW/gp25 family protein n=1 Tax=Pandoraea TaxID=93217 RepID=UPI001F5C721B|nr:MULTISPECIES: GPW/gp25 family protein [Pandoraea]MCI3205831.1 baseplate assembly protein [Pandoraea sp. LA3]MDN4583859.1 baseplate assembly protein [Pandoraea capi]